MTQKHVCNGLSFESPKHTYCMETFFLGCFIGGIALDDDDRVYYRKGLTYFGWVNRQPSMDHAA